jgi:hypothetical protein
MFRDRAVANLKADADRFAKNIAPIIREIQSTALHHIAGLRSRSMLAVSLPLWWSMDCGAGPQA